MMQDTNSSIDSPDASTGPAIILDSEESEYDYAGFISYRRSDASALANWLCHRLQDWRPTRDLLSAVPPDVAARLQAKRSVFVDTRFEVGSEDFWQAHIEPALARSAQLIVLSSPHALQQLTDGTPNWVEREIDTFYAEAERRDRITLVLCPGASENQWPGKLSQLSERWDWADLRRWSPRYRLFPGAGDTIDNAVTKILAAMLHLPPIFVPLMRQEEARRSRRRRTIYALASAAAMAVAAIGGLQTYRSIEEAKQQRLERQREESRRLADQSLRATESGDAVTGILLALQGIPSNLEQPDRPLVAQMWQPLHIGLSRQREIRILYHDTMLKSVAFSPDGTLIATGSVGGDILIRPLKNDRAPMAFHDQKGIITSISFSPDSTRIITGSSNGTALVRTLDDTTRPLRIPVQYDNVARPKTSNWGLDPMDHRILGVTSATFSPDGSNIAIGYSDGSSRIWSFGDEVNYLPLTPHSKIITSIAFSPDGKKIAVSSGDKTVSISRADSQDLLFKRELGRAVTSVAFSPDSSRIATGSSDGVAHVWSAEDGKDLFSKDLHRETINSLAFSPDGAGIASGSDDGTARIWRWSDEGEPPVVLAGHAGAITSVAYHISGKIIATASEDGTARIWLTDDIGTPLILSGHDDQVNSVAYSPDGTHIATGSEDGTARIWYSKESGDPLLLFNAESAITSLAYSPGGVFVATGAESGALQIWRTDNVGESQLLDEGASPVTSIAFNPNGRYIASGSADGTAHIWDVTDGGQVHLFSGHERSVTSVAFSPDGTRLATASADGSARVWHLGEDEDPIVFRDPSGRVTARKTSVAFSPSGAQIATGDIAGDLQIWNSNGTGLPLLIDSSDAFVTSISFSPDGTRIASGYDDGTIRIFSLQDASEPLIIFSGSQSVQSVAFSPDGQSIVAGLDDGMAKVWYFVGRLDQLVTLAHERVTTLTYPRSERSVIHR